MVTTVTLKPEHRQAIEESIGKRTYESVVGKKTKRRRSGTTTTVKVAPSQTQQETKTEVRPVEETQPESKPLYAKLTETGEVEPQVYTQVQRGQFEQTGQTVEEVQEELEKKRKEEYMKDIDYYGTVKPKKEKGFLAKKYEEYNRLLSEKIKKKPGQKTFRDFLEFTVTEKAPTLTQSVKYSPPTFGGVQPYKAYQSFKIVGKGYATDIEQKPLKHIAIVTVSAAFPVAKAGVSYLGARTGASALIPQAVKTGTGYAFKYGVAAAYGGSVTYDIATTPQGYRLEKFGGHLAELTSFYGGAKLGGALARPINYKVAQIKNYYAITGQTTPAQRLIETHKQAVFRLAADKSARVKFGKGRYKLSKAELRKPPGQRFQKGRYVYTKDKTYIKKGKQFRAEIDYSHTKKTGHPKVTVKIGKDKVLDLREGRLKKGVHKGFTGSQALSEVRQSSKKLSQFDVRAKRGGKKIIADTQTQQSLKAQKKYKPVTYKQQYDKQIAVLKKSPRTYRPKKIKVIDKAHAKDSLKGLVSEPSYSYGVKKQKFGSQFKDLSGKPKQYPKVTYETEYTDKAAQERLRGGFRPGQKEKLSAKIKAKEESLFKERSERFKTELNFRAMPEGFTAKTDLTSLGLAIKLKEKQVTQLDLNKIDYKELSVTKELQEVAVVSEVDTISKVDTKIDIKEESILDVKEKAALKEGFDTSLKGGGGTRTISEQPQKGKVSPPSPPRKPKLFKPVTIKTREPPKEVLWPVAKLDTPEPGVTGFDVFVRRKGQFEKINYAPLRRTEALGLGSFDVRTTPAATFKIEKAKEKATQRFKGSFDQSFFYRKGGLFIEKKKKRIDTPGELRGITFKGLAALRLRRR
jgi:hypothetical protein